MLVRSSVRPVLVCLELLIFIFWHQILQDDFRSVSGQSQVSLCLLCQAYFVRQTEPKILRLVRNGEKNNKYPQNLHKIHMKKWTNTHTHTHTH